MLRKVYRPKGLNLRDSDINRNPEFAQDIRNVEKNSKGELILRWGYEKVLDDAGIIDLFEYVGGENDPNRGSLFALKSDGLYKLDGSSLVKVNNQYNGTFTWTDQTKPVEYNKVLYWNDPAGVVDLWKFDGYGAYRAGSPPPSINTVTNNGGSSQTVYWRFILKFTDPQGNTTYSDYYSHTSGETQVTANFNPTSDQYFDGFFSRYCTFDSPGTLQTINSASPTVVDITSHNYQAGDYVLIKSFNDSILAGRTELDGVAVPVLVASVTATTITFNISSLGSKDYVVNDAFEDSLEKRWEIEAYSSTLEFSNYTRAAGTASGVFALNYNNAAFNLNFVHNTAGNPLNAVYDDTLVRVLPPKVKYLSLYNEFLIGAFLDKSNTDFGYASLLGNDTRLEDAFVWSDIATLNNGSSVETFLVNNIRPVGASEDGQISAIHGNDDNIVVHKEKQSYYINGDLITNTLRIRKAMTEQVGAASHRSTKNVEGGHMYTSPKGVFVSIGGAKPTELSDIIEPLFTESALDLGSLDLTKAKSVNDFLREKIYIYVPITGSEEGILLTYDYYYKEWFLHDNIPANNGFQDVGVSSTEIYLASSNSLYRRTLGTKKDDGKKIKGRYLTGWFDLDAPSIKKKFTNFILLSLSPLEWVATIKGYCNWNTASEEGSGSLNMDSSVMVDDYAIISGEANSVAYEVGNGDSGDDILITGYEVQFEMTQQTPKGDS